MTLKNGERLVRIPAPYKGGADRTGILDRDNKLVAYSKSTIGLNSPLTHWDWIRK